MNVERIVVLVAALVLWRALAGASVVCVMPDGKVYAGDQPPAGCDVKTKYRGLVKPSLESSNPDYAGALARRAELETAARYASRDLGVVEKRLASFPEVSPAPYANDPAGWQAYERTVVNRDAALRRLRSQRTALVWRLDSLKREFDVLTSTLAQSRGGRLPAEWEPFRCERCR